MKKNKKDRQQYVEDYTKVRFTMFFDEIDFIRLDFLDVFCKKIKELQAENIFAEEISKKIYEDFEKGIEALKNKEVEELWDLNKSVSQKTVFGQCDIDKKYKWVLENNVKNHCEDCLAREGQVNTFRDWETIGLPGAGTTECDYHCMCELVEVIE